MGIFATVFGRTAEGVVRVMLVQPVIFVQYRCSRCLQGWNAVEQIPQALKMVLHLTAAAHHIAAERILDTIAGTTGNVHRFQNVDMLSLHLSVTDQEAGCCQRRKATSHNIGRFFINTFRLLWTCKGLIVTI